MKGLAFIGKQSVRYADVPEPRLEQPGDAIVKLRLSAVCGSDLHVYHEREKGLDLGTVLGHEGVGEIVDTGPGVSRFRNGQLVLVPFSSSCGSCYYCERGLTSRCPSGELFGWMQKGQGLQGLQAEYARVPLADTTLLAVPEGVSLEEALLLGDVASTGFFAAEQADAGPAASLAVVGCGPVGLMAVLAARHLGAEAVFAVESVRERLTLARSFGAVALDRTRDEPVARVREATGGRGADAVIEAVGHPEAVRLALDLVRPGGTLVSVGVNTGAFGFSPAEAYARNLTYRVGRCPARAVAERVLPVIREGRYPFASVITHRFALAQGPRAYELFDKKRDGCIKVILTP